MWQPFCLQSCKHGSWMKLASRSQQKKVIGSTKARYTSQRLTTLFDQTLLQSFQIQASFQHEKANAWLMRCCRRAFRTCLSDGSGHGDFPSAEGLMPEIIPKLIINGLYKLQTIPKLDVYCRVSTVNHICLLWHLWISLSEPKHAGPSAWALQDMDEWTPNLAICRSSICLAVFIP